MGRDTGTLRKTMVVLTAIVLLLSVILCIHSISGHGLIGCTQGTSCNQVLGSKWSFLFGIIPVSALATGAYLTLLACILLIHSDNTGEQEKAFLYKAILIVCGAVTGSATWFIYLQYSMIHAFCPYCMTAHVLGIGISVLTVIWCARQKTGRITLNIFAGILLAVILAVVQFLTTPRSLAERGFTDEQLRYPNPAEMPIEGNPYAKHLITLLFDWQCSHCRRLHLQLPDAVSQLGDSIAVVCCPMSMSRECNPHIPQGIDRFRGSCQLMRTGLAVWRTDRSRYAEYEQWFMGTDINQAWHPRTVDEATSKAQELIGPEALDAALRDRWFDKYTDIVNELFGRTSRGTVAAIPRLIYNGHIIIPEADTPSDLADLILSLCTSE
jgi:uncharacterized membrane protein